MNSLTAWFKSKNITAHTIAAVAILAATTITTDQQVRDFVIGLFQAHPKIGTSILTVAGIILKYSHSTSAAGTVVAAEKVMASPNPPTPAAIAAATPTQEKP
jgi:heme A synthase